MFLKKSLLTYFLNSYFMQNDNVIKVFCNVFPSTPCSTYFFPLYFLFNVFCFLLKKTNIFTYIYYNDEKDCRICVSKGF